MVTRCFEYGLRRSTTECSALNCGIRKLCVLILSLDSLEHDRRVNRYLPVVRVLCFSRLAGVGVEKVNNKEPGTGSGHKDPARRGGNQWSSSPVVRNKRLHHLEIQTGIRMITCSSYISRPYSFLPDFSRCLFLPATNTLSSLDCDSEGASEMTRNEQPGKNIKHWQ